MKSFVGYSQGTGKNIATHEVLENGQLIHSQRFSPGAGSLWMNELIGYTNVIASSAMTPCKASGRIIIAVHQSVDSPLFLVHFFDNNGMDMGSSEVITPLISGRTSFSDVATTAWAAANPYAYGYLRVHTNSHLYQQVAATPDPALSGGTEPVWPTDGSSIVDNECTWHDLGLITGLQTTPLIIFSNSMGAAFFKLECTDAGGSNYSVFGGSL